MDPNARCIIIFPFQFSLFRPLVFNIINHCKYFCAAIIVGRVKFGNIDFIIILEELGENTIMSLFLFEETFAGFRFFFLL